LVEPQPPAPSPAPYSYNWLRRRTNVYTLSVIGRAPATCTLSCALFLLAEKKEGRMDLNGLKLESGAGSWIEEEGGSRGSSGTSTLGGSSILNTRGGNLYKNLHFWF